MRITSAVIALSVLIAILVPIATGIGLFWRAEGGPRSFTTLRGQTARIYGRGIYQYDSLFIGAGYRGQDAVALFLGVPLLVLAVFLYARGSMTGQLLLTGMLGYFLYVYASMALGAAYNRLFLVYVLLFSASLIGFILAFASVELDLLAAGLAGAPQQGLGIFLIVSGLVTLVVWGAPLVDAFLRGGPPDRLDSYTTMVTYAQDLAIITPATFVSGILVFRGEPIGYLIAVPLLALIVLLSPQIVLSTVFQRSAGVPFTTGEMIGPVAGFVVLGALAAYFLFALLRGIGSGP